VYVPSCRQLWTSYSLVQTSGIRCRTNTVVSFAVRITVWPLAVVKEIWKFWSAEFDGSGSA